MKLTINLSEIKLTLPFIEKESVERVNYPKKLNLILISLLTILSISAWSLFYYLGLTLAYNDARSHLNVARRVVDSLQPGFAQIGSVWLPLYHILELPFIWNDFLWHSGIAGSIISIVSYILGGLYLILIFKKLKLDTFALLAGLLAYAFNLNLLFMQATPMTESLLIFLSIGTVYYLINWVKDEKITSLVLAALFTFLSTLTRYDGWFLLAFMFFAVALISFKKKGLKFAEGNTIIYLTLAAFGVLLWIMWNWLIFGDPFYFALGEFSAKAQQDILLSEGRLLTKGNFIYSVFVYLLACIYNVGLGISLLSIAGYLLFIKAKEYSKNIKIAVSIFLVPFIFNIFSLYVGHSVIHIPEIPPYTWFNDRYGLMILPFVAVSVAFLVKGRKKLAIMVMMIIFTQAVIMYSQNRIITIEDGVRGASGDYLDKASVWISENIDEGQILVAASSNDALLFKSGIPLKRYITEGAELYWETSLVNPTRYANWVVMHKGDLVDTRLRDNDIFLSNYRLVYKDEFTYIYVLDFDTEYKIDEGQLP